MVLVRPVPGCSLNLKKCKCIKGPNYALQRTTPAHLQAHAACNDQRRKWERKIESAMIVLILNETPSKRRALASCAPSRSHTLPLRNGVAAELCVGRRPTQADWSLIRRHETRRRLFANPMRFKSHYLANTQVQVNLHSFT